MLYSPVFLKTENELNKVLKKQKRTRSAAAVLFVSLWDKPSQTLLRKLRSLQTGQRGKALYVVDSFTMPHAFVIFKTTKLPHLIQFKKSGVQSDDYLSKVYEELGL